jgi:hypothetical protein
LERKRRDLRDCRGSMDSCRSARRVSRFMTISRHEDPLTDRRKLMPRLSTVTPRIVCRLFSEGFVGALLRQCAARSDRVPLATAASRTRLWLAAGWEYRDRHPSRA